MTLILADRVLETCSSPGTGTVSLLGAVTGYQAFSATIGTGNTTLYTIADQSGANWEVGLGTYTSSGNTLVRTTVISSSNAGSLTNFSTGIQNVFVTYPAEQAVLQYDIGTLPSQIPINQYLGTLAFQNNNSICSTGIMGFAVGSGVGATVTQVTSRTTGVTINKCTGQITMLSAAGSATAATFTVTNSTVAAVDTVIVNQASGTNFYVLLVTAVAAGSFNITFYTTGGTATDAPVLNFSVIKGSAN